MDDIEHPTVIGMMGAIIISLGYILSQINLNYLWVSSLGFVINWYGDSLDGTLARVRNRQRLYLAIILTIPWIS